uniref:NADH-ubiquinone oxidoreductase chain 2 n=1 Tax=Cyclosa argenteoalba TaxID=345692 RepID=A0A0K0NTX1_9ARAC|nr:NADH dehydrogenase subunit 2 [Cyclosa argenteoalba]AKN58348.1 NADH dehydrogenase subunit 2 [Cyclosa argenteoalba]
MFAQSVLFFSSLYCMSFILMVSCSDWFLIWFSLEINMMSFIALIYNRSSNSVDVSMKYFFIQSIGSGILMLMFYSKFIWMDLVGLSVLVYKIGGGPFYFWFPSICESMGWGGCMLLMTMQKILPMLLITFMISNILWIFISSSIVIGAVGSFNQKSMKRLMAYSSIHHIGWILSSNYINESLWLIYLVMYSFMLSGVVYSLWNDKILEITQLGKVSTKMMFVLGMLSMGGMPPMLGFYLKWWLLYNLMSIDLSILLLMLTMSVLMFYVYLRVVYSVVMGGVTINSWKLLNKKSNSISLDLLYLMGINMGVIWMIL